MNPILQPEKQNKNEIYHISEIFQRNYWLIYFAEEQPILQPSQTKGEKKNEIHHISESFQRNYWIINFGEEEPTISSSKPLDINVNIFTETQNQKK